MRKIPAARIDAARQYAELRRVRNDTYGAPQRAGSVERSLGSAQHFDALNVVELKIPLDGRVADVDPYRRLLEGAEGTCDRFAGAVEAANDGCRRGAQSRAEVEHAEPRNLLGERSQIRGARSLDVIRRDHR